MLSEDSFCMAYGRTIGLITDKCKQFMLSSVILLHTPTSGDVSESVNQIKYHWVSAPGTYPLQLSPFWTKASAAPLLWSVKKTWCGCMQKNSITNRLHLHNFHQPILSCQKGLLLIGLEGTQKEESVEDEHGEASCGPLDAHVWLIKVKEDFFFSSYFRRAQGLQSWPGAVAECDTNKIEKGTWNEPVWACGCASVCACVCKVWMHLIILIWGHNTGSDGRCMRKNLLADRAGRCC